MAFFQTSLNTENDLDEEKAKRSILVTNVPGNITEKDVIIHFQRSGNGGGEVDEGKYLEPESRSSVVITFDDPETVETALGRPQVIKGNEVTVQRYPVRIPRVFSEVKAVVNPDVFTSVSTLKQVLLHLERDIGISHYENDRNHVITGSYEEIKLCHKNILDKISYTKAEQLADNCRPTAAATLGGEPVIPRSKGQRNVNDIETKNFQTVPIILEFIYNVPKHRNRIDWIESKFNVRIRRIEDDSKVAIQPLPGCTQDKHDYACEEYITLYREVYDGPMTSKNVDLWPGAGSSYSSAEEAVKEAMLSAPIAIQKIDRPDKWLFYGEENEVRSAIKEVCKKLEIDNPFRKNHKAISYAGAVNSNKVWTKSEGQVEAQKRIFTSARSLVSNDFPVDKEVPFEVETKKGFLLKVLQGDITGEPVDVIVNCTDELLGFHNSLSAALVSRGGRTIMDEARANTRSGKKWKAENIIVTGPGKLYCSKVFHIITPRYNTETTSKCKNFTADCCLNCLKHTQKEKLRSIAFPAVATGMQGMSLQTCAKAMINGIAKYMEHNDPKKGAVTDIRFVHLDPTAVEVFQTELKKRFAEYIVKPVEKDYVARGTKHSTLTLSSSGDVSYDKTSKKEDDDDVCPICLEKFRDPKSLSKCNHMFCKLCIDEAFKHRKVCPTCGMTYGMQTGNMPEGSMNHFIDHFTKLPGYERYSTIRLEYNFPSGVQGPKHPNPGKRYTGTSRTAYLPDCSEGREVLALLKKAFDARLTFTIGRSVTTGATDVVTWNDIHHKTCPHGGATGFGYPDPTYLKRVKAELAAKGIS